MKSQPNLKISPDEALITDLDFERLTSLFASVDDKNWDSVSELEEKIMNASVIDAHDAPTDLVTMNSMIAYRFSDQSEKDCELHHLTLVYPRDADILSHRISVLSQVGRAVLGSRIGEIVSWIGNDGCQRKMKLEELDYQPERSGDWHL